VTRLVSVVIPTRDRPALVRHAVDAVVGQDVVVDREVALDVVVVFDGSEPDRSLEAAGTAATVSVRTLPNSRTPGLAGSRNTGILAARGELVAFCDDDDVWEQGKLRAQLAALEDSPSAEMVTTAMTVDFRGRRSVRRAGRSSVDHAALVRSRMAMLHSSSFLIRTAALRDGIGLVDETLPRSMAEDWDLLLRAARRHPIRHVDEPLVRVAWGGSSYFAEQWQDRNEARLWLLRHHPEMAQDRRGAALSYGKLAFGCAALRRRREGWRWFARTVRTDWREPRAYLAAAVLLGLVRWQTVVGLLNRHGHGI
jgi:glycosyltransferase involved in cell wall biosynthesis